MAIISLIIISLINGLFILKYSSRIFPIEYAYLSSLIFIGISIISYYFRNSISETLNPISRKLKLSEGMQINMLLCIIITLWCAIFIMIPKESLRVDRWLMIKTFWDNVFSGNYPYTPLYSNNVPGQLPIYHILALPFHAIGEVGLLSLCVFLLLIWGIKKLNHISNNQYSIRLFLLIWLLSPAMWWEQSTRSTIVMNMNLVILFFIYNEIKPMSVLKKGILGGFLTATRSSVLLPLSVGVFGELIQKKRWGDSMKIALCSGIVPIVCLLLLYLWDSEKFFLYNPLAMQSLFLPTWLSVLFIAISIVLGMKTKNLSATFFYSGCMLFLVVFAAFCFALFRFGWHESVFADAFDISYFLQAMPFVMVVLIYTNKSNRMSNV